MIPSFLPWGVASSLLLATGLYIYHEPEALTTEPVIRFKALSAEIGSWNCNLVQGQKATYQDPNMSGTWSGVCQQREGHPIEVYLGYMAEQKGKKKIQSPRINYPNHDTYWSYAFGRVTEVPLPIQGEVYAINQTLLQHVSGQKNAVSYWYQMENESFADEYRYRFSLMLRNLMWRSTRTVMVRLSVPFRDEGLEGIFLEEKELAQVLYPEVMQRFF
jgi:EpsI family protein